MVYCFQLLSLYRDGVIVISLCIRLFVISMFLSLYLHAKLRDCMQAAPKSCMSFASSSSSPVKTINVIGKTDVYNLTSRNTDGRPTLVVLQAWVMISSRKLLKTVGESSCWHPWRTPTNGSNHSPVAMCYAPILHSSRFRRYFGWCQYAFCWYLTFSWLSIVLRAILCRRPYWSIFCVFGLPRTLLYTH